MQVQVLRLSSGEVLEGQINGRLLKVVETAGATLRGPESERTAAGRLVLGQVAAGDLEPGGVHAWSLDAAAGSHIQIDAWGFDTFLRLLDPEGTVLREDDDGHPDFVFGSRLLALIPADGLYTVELSGIGESGAYSIVADISSAVDRGVLSAGVVTTAEIGLGGVDLWRVDHPPGTPLRIETRGFDTVVALYEPSLRLVAADDDSGIDNGSLIDLREAAPGAYVVEVHGFAGMAGSYQIGYNADLGAAGGAQIVEVVDATGALRAEAPEAWQVLTATDSGDLATLHLAPDVETWFSALQAPNLRLDVTGATVSLLDLGRPVGPDDVATLMEAFAQAIVPEGCQAADPIPRADGDLFGSLSPHNCGDASLLLGITVERDGIEQAALFVAVAGNDTDAAHAEHVWKTLQLGG